MTLRQYGKPPQRLHFSLFLNRNGNTVSACSGEGMRARHSSCCTLELDRVTCSDCKRAIAPWHPRTGSMFESDQAAYRFVQRFGMPWIKPWCVV